MSGSIDRDWIILLAFCGLYATWILLPMIPAILIYWLFPDNKVAVSGPFAGLTVKASGAFAAYLVVFAAVYLALVPVTRDYIVHMRREFWTVKGDIELRRADGTAYPHSDALLNTLKVRPATYRFDGDTAVVKIEEDEEGGFPVVVIEIPNFGEQTIPLNHPERKFSIDYSRRIIRINDPVVIRENGAGGRTQLDAVSLAGAETRSTDSSDRPR